MMEMEMADEMTRRMKKHTALFFIFLSAAFFAAVSLSAQETMFIREDEASLRETKIYVPPIDGIGAIEDMAFFFKQITGEITRQYRLLGRTRFTSDYVITGRIMPIAELEDEIEMPPDSEEDEYILFVELFDNQIQEIIGIQYITYTIPDESTEEALSVIIYNLLSGIPGFLEGFTFYDAWRNKILYLNVSFLWTPRIYIGDYQSVNISGVGAEVTADYHFLSWLALSVNAELSQDWVVTYTSPDEMFMDMVLAFPVAAKFVFRPGESFMLEPYLGMQYTFSLLGRTHPYPLAWLIGAQIGINLGYGIIITFDPRFTMDFSKSYIVGYDDYLYWRYSIHLGVGIKYGFWDRVKPVF